MVILLIKGFVVVEKQFLEKYFYQNLFSAILRVEISSPPAPADLPRARPLTTPPRSVPGSTLELLLPTDTRPVPLPPNCPNLPVR